jgi:hypothetical protein
LENTFKNRGKPRGIKPSKRDLKSEFGNHKTLILGYEKQMLITLSYFLELKAVDELEFSTDLSSINHGLGYQLLEWSTNVRVNLKRINWLRAVNLSEDEKNERYINPSAIAEVI